MHEVEAPVAPYRLSRCPSGCMHLIWRNVSLHLSEDEFLILASIVRSAHRELEDERSEVARGGAFPLVGEPLVM